jgi:hypothetical protein
VAGVRVEIETCFHYRAGGVFFVYLAREGERVT